MVHKGLYLILAFFLGGLGIHKMYAGHFLIGLLYLAFCWTYIPVVLSLIDVVVALLKRADHQGHIWV